MSLDAYIREYLTSLKTAESTKKAYAKDLAQLSEFVNNDLLAIDEKCLKIFFSKLNQNYKPRTVFRKMQSLRAFFNYLIKDNIIAEHPMSNIKVNYEIAYSSLKSVSNEDVKRFIDTAYDDYINQNNDTNLFLSAQNLFIVLLLFNSGVRSVELCEMRIEDVNLNDNTVAIRGKYPRYIRLTNEFLIKTMKMYLNRRININANSNYLFLKKYGTPFSVGDISSIFNVLSKKSDVHITPKLARHTYEFELIKNNIPQRVITEIMGGTRTRNVKEKYYYENSQK